MNKLNNKFWSLNNSLTILNSADTMNRNVQETS